MTNPEPPPAHGWWKNRAMQEWWLYRDGVVVERVTVEAWDWYIRECERTRGGIPL